MGNRSSARKQQNISQGSRLRCGALKTELRLARLLHLAAQFDETLDKCSGSVQVETVHRVRTGSRRLRAMVETVLREDGAQTGSLAELAHGWLRELKRVRRKAAFVRDLDVHRKLLKKPLSDSVRWFAANEEEERAARNRLRDQAARLDDWLKDQRRVRTEALKRYLEKHGPKLEQRKSVFLAAAAGLREPQGKVAPSAETVALSDFARLADAMPALDADNLHDFRKAVKKARYIAESGGIELGSKRLCKAFKQVQDAIGAWHDWFRLTQEAQTALGEDGAELIAWLTNATGRHFNRALATTGRIREELLGKWRTVQNRTQPRPGRGPGRKPASRAAAVVSAKSA